MGPMGFFLLTNDIILKIILLLAVQDPTALGRLRQSCKRVRLLANDPNVLKKLDMSRFVSRLSFINDPGRAFLALLSNNGIQSASLLIATDLFFNKKDSRNGIHALLNVAKGESFQAKYNCAIALNLLRKRKAWEMFEKILLLPDSRYTLK
ncbi:hypothetical protein ACFE04_026886 [Oxalis oulophora]